MKSTLKISIAAAAFAFAGFIGTAQAEGEYQYVAPMSYSDNIVGGGATEVVNTGNPDAPVRIVHTDSIGAQHLGRGQIAVIGGGQDDYQTVLVAPTERAAGNPPSLLSSFLGSRFRG